MLVRLSWAYSHLRPSPAPGFWACWEPPDSGEDSRQHVHYAVNEKMPLSVMKRSRSYWTVLMLSTILPMALQEWAKCLHSRNIEHDWRARCKPPNARGTFQQPSTTTMSVDGNTSVKCSPLFGAAFILLMLLLASSSRANKPCCPENKLIPQAHKPPNPMAEHGPLVGGVSEVERGQEMEPITSSLVHVRSSRRSRPSLCCRMAFIFPYNSQES